MRQRDLLAAIASLGPIRYRAHSSGTPRCAGMSCSPAPQAGAGARRTYEVLYLGRPRTSVVIEAYRHLVDDELDDTAGALAANVLERRIVTCKIDVPNILDLRPNSARNAVSLTDAQLFSDVGDYGACQAIGAAAHQLGLAGLIAPATSGQGETLAPFSANLPAEHRPKVTKRDIWRGLPPDPRRLRLVDEA